MLSLLRDSRWVPSSLQVRKALPMSGLAAGILRLLLWPVPLYRSPTWTVTFFWSTSWACRRFWLLPPPATRLFSSFILSLKLEVREEMVSELLDASGMVEDDEESWQDNFKLSDPESVSGLGKNKN